MLHFSVTTSLPYSLSLKFPSVVFPLAPLILLAFAPMADASLSDHDDATIDGVYVPHLAALQS